jgi:hypothetical protein
MRLSDIHLIKSVHGVCGKCGQVFDLKDTESRCPKCNNKKNNMPYDPPITIAARSVMEGDGTSFDSYCFEGFDIIVGYEPYRKDGKIDPVLYKAWLKEKK